MPNFDESITITGHINNYVFESDSYRVCNVVKTDGKKITVVGYFPHLDEGLEYDFTGKIKNHLNYGEQFYLESYSKSATFTKDGLISYLSSDKFPGIGEKIAEEIVEKLGLDCIDMIIKRPGVLDDIESMTNVKRKNLVKLLKENVKMEKSYIKLMEFGLSMKMTERLIEIYGADALGKIEEDPYRLIYEVDGFGFKKSDALAMNLGFKINDIKRIKASIAYTLNFVCYQQGFTFLNKEQLILSTKKLLDNNPAITDDIYENALVELEKEKKIISEENRYFDFSLYKNECDLAKRVKAILKHPVPYSLKSCEDALDYVSKNISITYTPLQKEAIINSLSNSLSIITGGPGTGKSTILKGILDCYAYLNNSSLSDDLMSEKILLVSPTGRASKRMTETTKFKASTIHRALGYNYQGEFTYVPTNPLEYSLIVIDEASMLDVSLAASLFRALPDNVQVILVGDVNQLPSVGPGNVLSDLISTNLIKTTKLNQIMRQADGSNIIKLSAMIQAEKVDYRIFSEKKEVYFYKSDSNDLIDSITKILDNFISKGGDFLNDMQILIPMYHGPAGIDYVNLYIQGKYNSESEKMIIRDFKKFKKGDKVLQTKNDAILDVMNGDIGIITDIVKGEEKDEMFIDFDGRMVNYPVKNLDDLSLAYAISIHKSQGSEFKNVIVPILPSYNIMLRKKIIYTAITRAKEKVIILGQPDSLNVALKRGEYNRQTYLAQRITNEKKEENKISIPGVPFDTFGEYDMEGVTPYTFMDK